MSIHFEISDIEGDNACFSQYKELKIDKYTEPTMNKLKKSELISHINSLYDFFDTTVLYEEHKKLKKQIEWYECMPCDVEMIVKIENYKKLKKWIKDNPYPNDESD